MTEYKVKGINPQTNRINTKKIIAKDETSAKIEAEKLGLQEPFTIEIIPPELATERQIAYARNLGLIFPDYITKEEMSDLLDRRLEGGDKSPNPGLIAFARGRGLEFTDYISKDRLYDMVFYGFPTIDRIAFFVFCMYRSITNDREANLDVSPHKSVIYQIAAQLEQDEKFLPSMNRYRGTDIKFFGTLKQRCSDGGVIEHQGGSTRTYAYTTAKNLMNEHNLLNTIYAKQDFVYQPQPAAKSYQPFPVLEYIKSPFGMASCSLLLISFICYLLTFENAMVVFWLIAAFCALLGLWRLRKNGIWK